jgi:hypothetical protein
MTPCACGCLTPVTGRGRFATKACWARTMNAGWTAERRRARAAKGGHARHARDVRGTVRSATSRLV